VRRSGRRAINNTFSLRLHDRCNNRNLFADNYLKHHLAGLPGWQEYRGLDDSFAAIKRLYNERAGSLADANESQTEHDFIRPILDILWQEESPGDCYQVQVVIPNLNGHRQPDYALFRRAEDRVAADALRGQVDYWRGTAALADAKGWNVSLDRSQGPDRNPSAQIANYLYRSGVRWGILTNGRQWRLYEREKSSPGGVYFEVDLLAAIQHDDRETFRFLWTFFRRAAFLPDADGKTFLERVFQGSVDYATEVGGRLKESVYDALRLIMNGFLRDPANALDRADPEHVRLAHENGLILLYRLLFLLYAEDKDLLPLDKDVYLDHSLKTIHSEVNPKLRGKRRYYAGEHRFWPQLLQLFRLIDEGLTDEGEVVVPAYNGGLFSVAKFPHIAHTPEEGAGSWQIGDGFLCPAIDMLAYRRDQWDKPGSQDIDYNSLDVQHLGSIYEGLLELRPAIAEGPLVEVSSAGKPTFKPQAEVAEPARIRGQNPRKIAKGEVYLVTDRGERKATGSYYTPKYIVDYIVQNTVGPLADEAAHKVAELRPEVEREIAGLEQRLAEGQAEAPSEIEARKRSAEVLTQIAEKRRKLLEPYLALKVLDPAMGSGHFLVGAADFLSLAMATDPNIAVPEEVGEEEAQAHYKRLVVERCLYGVDLNPLAVELAKLSLWLHTVSKDKALSFLDHHFRCGNSLIGAGMSDLGKQPLRFDARGKVTNAENGQLVLGFSEALTAKHLQYFLDSFREIMESPSGELESERHKADLYAAMDAARDRYRAVANCWLAPYFGAPVTPPQYESAVSALRNPDEWPALEREDWFVRAQEVAREKRFFHWELEFPEQFFTPRGLKPEDERGFGAVIGNPPYGSILTSDERLYASTVYASSGTTNDVFAIFIERDSGLLSARGLLGLIVPSGWLTARQHRPLRQLALSRLAPLNIVHLPYDVFEDAYIDCIVFIGANGAPAEGAHCLIKRFGSREPVIHMPSSPDHYMPIPVSEWTADSEKAMITDPVAGQWLGRWRRSARVFEARDAVGVSRGITPYEEAVPADPRGKALGFFGSVGRYDLQAERYAEVTYDPTLSEYKPAEFFEGRRLVIRRIISRQHRIHATLVDEDFVINKSYLLAIPKGTQYALEYLLAVLNSRLMSRAFVAMSDIAKRDDFPQLDIATVEELPIRRIDFTTPADERAALVYDFAALHIAGDCEAALTFAADQLAQQPQRTDVVHDALAHLARQMIDLHRGKREETAGFVAWLERYIGTPIHDLTGKTKLTDYHEHDLGTLIAVLKQNRAKIGINPDSRAAQEEIAREFEASLAKLNPLKERIAATDSLIDRIVYKLYGLTEDEIRIVEGE